MKPSMRAASLVTKDMLPGLTMASTSRLTAPVPLPSKIVPSEQSESTPSLTLRLIVRMGTFSPWMPPRDLPAFVEPIVTRPSVPAEESWLATGV